MVTILEAGIFESFSRIFAMVLIIAIVYAILQFTNFLKAGKGVHGLIAIIIGLLMLISPDIMKVVMLMIPWFVLMFIFIILLLLGYMLFGAKEADFLHVLKTDRTVVWVILIICIVIIISVLSQVYSQRFLTAEEGEDVGEGAAAEGVATASYSKNVAATIFHPKILGMIFIALVAVFTIGILTAEAR
ncbi:hypothetical protein KY339_01645 [Candidatus Woesearchaeota archaeon]|nr:hypothetical protein [Candidatus Woesearchaeota archaeon]